MRRLADDGRILIPDTAAGRAVPLQTKEPGVVRLYVCGPTVSRPPHVGHGRSYVIFDVLRRFLGHEGYRVIHVQNVTDIEEAVSKGAASAGVEPAQYADRLLHEYHRTFHALNILQPHHEPRVTEYIGRICRATETLVDKGWAYRAGDTWVLDTARVPEFGKLLRRRVPDVIADPLERIPPTGRRDPIDFTVWRDRNDIGVTYPGPGGREGRPGWHTECAVMALDLLGHVDIHGGGADLVYPHHESERAIAHALTGEELCTHYLHNGLILVDQMKMSKSLGNVVSLLDEVRRWGPGAVRLCLLSAPVTSHTEWDDECVALSKERYRVLAAEVARMRDSAEPAPPGELKPRREFLGALRNGFRVDEALTTLERAAHKASRDWASMSPEARGAHVAFTNEALEILGLECGP